MGIDVLPLPLTLSSSQVSCHLTAPQNLIQPSSKIRHPFTPESRIFALHWYSLVLIRIAYSRGQRNSLRILSLRYATSDGSVWRNSKRFQPRSMECLYSRYITIPSRPLPRARPFPSPFLPLRPPPNLPSLYPPLLAYVPFDRSLFECTSKLQFPGLISLSTAVHESV